MEACSDRSFARHTHEEFGVGIVTAGAQRSWSGRGQVEAITGDIITVNPGEVHDGAAVGAARSWSMLYLSQAKVGSVVADRAEERYRSRELYAPVITDCRLARLFGSTRRAALHPGGTAAFEERLALLFAGLFGIASGSESVPAGELSRVRERIEDAPEQPHSLGELAALAGLIRYQTVRGFARLNGLTPHAYFLQSRLDLAKRLIRQGEPLAGAAAAAGFADQSHMHRVFATRHGYTPGTYAAAHVPAAISSKRMGARVR